MTEHLDRESRDSTGVRGGVAASVALAVLLAVGAAAGARSNQATVSVEYDDPAWSPNGKTIAAVVRTIVTDGQVSTTNAALVTIDVHVPRERTIVILRPDRIAWPDWSPDGRWLVFRSEYLYAVDAAGRRLREIGPGCCASWGPGGRRIAFSTGPETQSEIFVMNPDGRRREVVASPDQEHSYWGSTWSPDGERLAFFSDEAPDMAAHAKTSLAVINRFQGRVRQLKSGVYAAEPDWSPAGDKVAFNGIRVLDLSTNRVVMLHEGRHPRWSPDGRQLAFVYKDRLFLMKADGTAFRQLTR